MGSRKLSISSTKIRSPGPGEELRAFDRWAAKSSRVPYRLLAVDPSTKLVGWSLWQIDPSSMTAAFVESGHSDQGSRSSAIQALVHSPIVVIENQFVGVNPSTAQAILESRVRVQQRAEDAGATVVLVSPGTWQHALLYRPGETFIVRGKPAKEACPPPPGKRKGRPARPATQDRETHHMPSPVIKARSRLHALSFAGASQSEDEADATCIGHWATQQIVGV